MKCDDVRALVHASVDGELDLLRQVEIDEHVSQCQACGRAYDEQRALREVIAKADLYVRAPARVHEAARKAFGANAARRPWLAPTWTRLAAAAAVLLAVALAGWFLRPGPAPTDVLAQEILSSHLRSLLPGHATDVLSSDQHTVKPWFAGRVDFSPPVVDLAPDGFPLVGGRLDYVGGRTVAALVYQRRQHVVNLFVWPTNAADRLPETARTLQGYHLISWRDNANTFCAVSDVNTAELDAFSRLIRQRTQH